MTTKKTTDIETLRNHLEQEFTHNHLDTLKKVAQGSYIGEREDLITAFKATGTKIRRTDADYSDFKITSTSGQKWLITLPMNIELHNGVNALSEAARATLKECQEIMKIDEPAPSAH